jgi:cysteine-S-conjugate beta-lyase
MPIQRASTILFESLAELDRARTSKHRPGELYYGAMGTQTAFAFEEAMTAFDGGYGAVAVGTGLAACTTALLAFARQGDHLLVTDSVYDPTRAFCDGMLAALGVETTYFDPLVGDGIHELIRPNTRVIFLESPGSHTFEVQDVPTICRIAREHAICTMLDNTWATPLYFRALEHGVDIVIHAATKYVGGHSDILVGVIVTGEAHYAPVREAAIALGQCLSPDDAYLALRGLRTMSVRMEYQQRNALALARWLQTRPEVIRVLHPALPDDPGHAIWKRDFLGSSGLFAFVLPPAPREALAAMLDSMKLFGMGYSWGGFESLIIPGMPSEKRKAARWDPAQGTLMRINVGLEEIGDLQRDLAAGLERWKTARSQSDVHI